MAGVHDLPVADPWFVVEQASNGATHVHADHVGRMHELEVRV